MSLARKTPPADKPLLMQALADTVGATKSQIQFWTDHGILGYLPGTGGGQGHNRVYPRSELPFAAMARSLAAHGVQVGAIDLAVFGARLSLNPHSTLKGAKPQWHRRALRGHVESYMVLSWWPRGDGSEPLGFTWVGRDQLLKKMSDGHGAIVLNVQRVLSPYAE